MNGSLLIKPDNPAVLISVSEQVESTHSAFKAGVSCVHAFVRNGDETSSGDPEKFAALATGVVEPCKKNGRPVATW